MSYRLCSKQTCLAVASLALLPQVASAGAFQLREGSAAAQGMSLAGRASYARDVSFVLGNPAALRGVQGFAVTSGIAAVLAISEGTLNEAPAAPAPFTNPRGEPGTFGAVPSLALGYRLNEQFVLGLTLDSPFGLATSYDNDWAGAFDGVESELLTVSVTPMISYQPMPELAIAGGVSFQYSDARLSNATAGGIADISGDDFGIGFILGLAWDPLPGTSLGIRYRSGMDLDLEGDFSSNYIIPTASGLVNLGGPGTATATLPASLNFGFTQAIGERWRVMAEMEFTDWSANEEITITSKTTGIAIPDPQNYEDSWMGAIGAEYDYSDVLTFRGGIAFDQTPTTDASRTTRTPDSDRYWVSIGLSYEISERIGVDAGYTYIFLPQDADVTFRQTANTARFENEIHVLGVNARYRF